jgi:putative component of toxin-antitoxin plasmid stabilization module
MDGETLVILLAGGSKQRQPADIGVAKTLWKQYKQGKRS